MTGKVIDDTDGEVCLGSVFCKVLINGKDGRGGRIFGTETVTAADNLDTVSADFVESGNNVEVKRFAESARLFGTVKYGDFLCGCGDGFCKFSSYERTVQSDFDKTDFFAFCHQVVDNFFGNVANGAHRDDDSVGIGSAVVVEEFIVGAEFGIDFVHVGFYDGRKCIVVGVAGFSVLEEDITVLGRAAKCGMFGVQSTVTESTDSVHVNHFGEVFVIPSGNFLNFVRGTETVKEVQERNASLDGGKVCNGTEVHDFLCVGLGKHGKTGLTAGINVGVIAEDVQSVRCYASCGYVDDAGKKFAGNLVHIRDHQKKTLRCGVSGGQSTGCQGTVNGTGSAGLGLHLDDLYIFTENVLRRFAKDVLVGCRPGVCDFCHRAGRRDGVDGGNFRERVRYVRGGSVTIHRDFLSLYHEVFLRI